jgi:hypothetical protein
LPQQSRRCAEFFSIRNLPKVVQVSDFLDHQHVRDFLTIVNEQAARVTAGMPVPGHIAMLRIHPEKGAAAAERFMIGDVANQTQFAIDAAVSGHNAYIEARTVRPGISGNRRGKAEDTIAVFALVRDNDNDKGKGGTAAIATSMVVESSPGNTHDWLFLEPGISVQEAIEIGRGMKAATGGDDDTGVITQPYRVAGTPNYPDRKKRERGRTVAPTKIIKTGGPVWTKEQLLAAFPAPPREARTQVPSGRSGVVGEGVEAIVADGSGDRSVRFYDAVKAARAAGMLPDDLEDLMRKHPNGCATKYLQPKDRLHNEIERAWSKLGQRPKIDPTYPDAATADVTAARAEVERLINHFLEAATAPKPEKSALACLFDFNTPEQLVHAFAAMTGVGKTRIAAKCIAKYVKTGKLAGPVGYGVPTHRLGEDIANIFRRYGLTAAVWRGRKAFISGKDGPTMCGDLPAVIEAEKAGEPIETACCKGKNQLGIPVTCPFYQTCAYQKQKHQKPDVWIFAHQMLFRAQSAINELSVLFIDESFQEAGQSKPKNGVTLDELDKPLSLFKPEVANDLEPYRMKLARALRASEDDGVSQTSLVNAGLTADDCTEAIKLEWKLKEKVKMWPGMPLERRAKAVGNVGPIRAIDRVWRAARDLLENHEDDVISGRLFLVDAKTEHGVVRMAKTRGVLKVAEQYQVPTMIMDATLPDKLILEKWFPDVKTVDSISATTPHVSVRQVLGAPITKKKLLEGETERRLQEIRRYILKRWIECGRQKTLVICQKAVVESDKGAKDRLAKDMQDSIHFEWFNNVAGLDEYKDVRLLITIGRTLPKPFEVESTAGLLSGVRPVQASVQPNGGTWFDRVQRAIRLRGSATGPAMWCDQHPDPLAEAVRKQVCEAELIQAIGRGRGVNRTTKTPLDIDILGDVVLPVTVDQVEEWVAPSKVWEMAAEGIWLESPSDMARAWPGLWKDADSAKNWQRSEQGVISLNRDSYKGKTSRVRYQRPGPKQKWKEAWYDPGVLKDPRGWLEARVGPLSEFAVDEGMSAAGQPIERWEVDMGLPDGRTVTTEHLVFDGAAITGRVAVSCLMGVVSPDTRIAA